MPDPQTGSNVDLSKRLLDPACGSGTFLILAIRSIKEHARRQGLGETETLEIILQGVMGVDLNPLAVLAARVGYLLAIADLVPFRRGPIAIPVFLADSIRIPTEGATLFEHGQRVLDTVVGRFPVPENIRSADELGRLTEILHEYVQGRFSLGAFLDRACNDFAIAPATRDWDTLSELYQLLTVLHQDNRDAIWARVIKNAFMPLFLGRFDYVVGNPPWVNWESLPEGYRKKTVNLWAEYKLFPHTGFQRILGGSSDDISVLMTYVSADRYLKSGGTLAFVITQTVFKTAAAGKGFRRFQLGNGEHLGVRLVEDMSELRPFEGAANRTSVLIMDKGVATRFPVPYKYWKKTVRRAGLGYDSTLDQVLGITRRLDFEASPVDPRDLTSPWLTGRAYAVRALQSCIGASEYQARKGVYASANGVFWLEVVATVPPSRLIVRNLRAGAKQVVEAVTTDIESALVFPLLRGRDVSRWRATPSAHILVTHASGRGLNAIDQRVMERTYPRTIAYLRLFEKQLRQTGLFRRYFTRRDRRGKTVETGPFYSMFDIGGYTFAPYKVVWREVASSLTAAVVDSHHEKVVIPDHKLVLLPCDDLEEACYVCAVLNSTITNFIVMSYAVGTQIAPHIFDFVAVPIFDSANSCHMKLAQLGAEAHKLAAGTTGGDSQMSALETRVDMAVAELWGIDRVELEAILESAREFSQSAVRDESTD